MWLGILKDFLFEFLNLRLFAVDRRFQAVQLAGKPDGFGAGGIDLALMPVPEPTSQVFAPDPSDGLCGLEDLIVVGAAPGWQPVAI